MTLKHLRTGPKICTCHSITAATLISAPSDIMVGATIDVPGESAIRAILLQKLKVAGPRIFRENTKRQAITDSNDLNRVVEVACEFNVRR
jgi:hypothetical protein